MARQTVFGPYRVIPVGEGERWEIVEMVDIHPGSAYEWLRPRRIYEREKRTSAYRAVALLNRSWQQDHEHEPEILHYWQSATS